MSRKPEQRSNEEQQHQDGPSVYDFLYQDVRRVGSFLAQFHPEGLLQSTRRTQSVEDSYTDRFGAQGQVNVGIARGKLESKDISTQSSLNASERAYDPLWQNSIALLTFLQNQGYLHRTLENARVGQMVLVSGNLEVFDVRVLLNLYSDPHNVRQAAQVLTGGHGAAGKGLNKAALDKLAAGVKLFSRLPQEVQALLQTPQSRIWCVLRGECLETTSTNLWLKYGSRISGLWSVLGILDAFPDPDNADTPAVDRSPEVHNLFEVSRALDPLARHIGRPATAHGVTPLLIFRKVEAAK